MHGITISDARMTDIGALAALETASFHADRLSPRSFRRLAGSASAALRIARVGGDPAGYCLLLFRAGTTVARLYSIAVDPRHRGGGLAGRLVEDAERIARKRGRTVLRLEVREDNHAALRLYKRLGYRTFGRYQHYYADGADALRCEKSLDRRSARLSSGPDEDRSSRDAGVSTKLMPVGHRVVASTASHGAAVRSAARSRAS
jgi:ribosomal protein S18 acetylase RimI-like enzyme